MALDPTIVIRCDSFGVVARDVLVTVTSVVTSANRELRWRACKKERLRGGRSALSEGGGIRDCVEGRGGLT